MSPRKTDCTNSVNMSVTTVACLFTHFDNATTAPDAGNTGVVQVPTQLFRGLAHKHEALCVRDDLGSIQCLLQIIDKLFLVATENLFLRARNNLAGTDTLGL